jgi:electron transfer flavoprotein alpha subunit
MPSSPDGRDLAPRLAAVLDRPLIAHSVVVHAVTGEGGRIVGVRAQVSRLDDRVLVPVVVDGPAVATLVVGSRTVVAVQPAGRPEPLTLAIPSVVHEPIVLDILEPDPETMDLADAARVMSGGAGLATGLADQQARDVFDLLVRVAGAIDASAGATRVATDAGWIGYERQIGTTGVTVRPELYIAFGVSGATQHVGGVGTPHHVVSVNIDPSCPMTAMADLGLVTDARALLAELARRFAVDGFGQADQANQADRVGTETAHLATNEVGHG